LEFNWLQLDLLNRGAGHTFVDIVRTIDEVLENLAEAFREGYVVLGDILFQPASKRNRISTVAFSKHSPVAFVASVQQHLDNIALVETQPASAAIGVRWATGHGIGDRRVNELPKVVFNLRKLSVELRDLALHCG